MGGHILRHEPIPNGKDLIRTAIEEGFKERGLEEICNLTYFTKIARDLEGKVNHRTLRTSNTTIAFGVKLGLYGLLAYNLTFGAIEDGSGTGHGRLHTWAEQFVRNVEDVEEETPVKKEQEEEDEDEEMNDPEDATVPTTPDKAGDTTDNSEPATTKFCEAFDSPSGNMVIKANDNVLFRIEDYYLQAAG